MKISDLEQMGARIEVGAWMDLPSFPGVKVKVRGDGNSDHDRIIFELWSLVPADKRGDATEAERVNREAAVQAILLDWSGIDEPCTPETATEALKVASFYRGVRIASRLVGAQGRETLEADLKN